MIFHKFNRSRGTNIDTITALHVVTAERFFILKTQFAKKFLLSEINLCYLTTSGPKYWTLKRNLGPYFGPKGPDKTFLGKRNGPSLLQP